mgnify:CR=1 FL=1
MNRAEIRAGFWQQRLQVNASRAIFHQWEQLEASGCIQNFRIAAGETEGWREGWFFADSDAYKWLDAAARIWATHPDKRLGMLMDGFIGLLGRAQAADGYLFTYNQIHFPGVRWQNLQIEHELYCHGHLIEAGVSHFEATGRQELLEIALKAAQRIADDFSGKGPAFTPGHEEIELALLRLSEVSGEKRYQELARQFLEQRGRQRLFGLGILRQNLQVAKRAQIVQQRKQAYLAAHPDFKPYRLPPGNAAKKPGNTSYRWYASALSGKYFQQHAPVGRQNVPVGHAVRFTYLQTAIARLCRLSGEQSLRPALERAWERMVTRRMYVTGGIGSLPGLEGFGNDYELDPEYAYAETCAALGSLFWNWEMVQLTGQAAYSDIHLAFQWLLDPDGDPNTMDAPDVVNASWGLVGTAGRCLSEFNHDIDVLKTAGTAIVFAAGNDGPAPQTSLSPANNLAAFSTGAVDSDQLVASFSSRGPSTCDDSIYPKLVAPGVNINTSDLSFGGLPLYAVVSGTSFAVPHTAGAMTLLAGAFPQASVGELESALTASARDLGAAGADNSYGYGLVDVQAAYQMMASGSGNAPSIVSTPPTTAFEGRLYHYPLAASDADGDELVYSLDVAPAGMNIDAYSGLIAWTPTGDQVGAQTVIVRVTDPGGLFATQSFTIAVAGQNAPPVAQNDVYRMIRRGTLSIAAPGILANDSDPDSGDALMAVNFGTLVPEGGALVHHADGSFNFTPPRNYIGTKRFSYQAQDSAGATSEVATVSITVAANRRPLAVIDTASAPVRRRSMPYEPVIVNLLANDRDPDTAIDPYNTIDPASVMIMRAPNKGGRVAVNGDGTIAYTPRPNFAGVETFLYRVKDTYDNPAASNAAVVRINVQ